MIRTAKVAGLCLASMLVMSMALAGTASAALLWLVCLKGVGLTKYTNEKCLKANGGPPSENGWQSLGLLPSQSVTVKILVLSLKLEDTKSAIASSVVCLNKGSIGEGLIEAEGKGNIKVARYANAKEDCRGTGGCEEVEEIEGIGLPWKTELFVGTDGTPLTKIIGGGWKVKCKTFLGSKTDECTEETNKPEEAKLTFGEVTENPAKEKELLVRALFQEKVKGKCTEGGKETGRVKGTVAILLPGGALSINR